MRYIRSTIIQLLRLVTSQISCPRRILESQTSSSYSLTDAVADIAAAFAAPFVVDAAPADVVAAVVVVVVVVGVAAAAAAAAATAAAAAAPAPCFCCCP